MMRAIIDTVPLVYVSSMFLVVSSYDAIRIKGYHAQYRRFEAASTFSGEINRCRLTACESPLARLITTQSGNDNVVNNRVCVGTQSLESRAR